MSKDVNNIELKDITKDYIDILTSGKYKHRCKKHGFVQVYVSEDLEGNIISECNNCRLEEAQEAVEELGK